MKSLRKTALYGAILGDIIGVPFEFDRNRPQSKDSFPLFCKDSHFSDDTVTTIAIADAFWEFEHIPESHQPDQLLYNILKDKLQYWCRKYPYSGYGTRFCDWIFMDHPKPYGSSGNGAAMRVSAAGWFCDKIKSVRKCAKLTAMITHNHPEGIKGAEATASAIFLARAGLDKVYIKHYIESEFGYDLRRTIDDMRPYYRHTEKIWETVPEAIIAFLESHDFESTVRNTVWLGGDVDTLGAIAGSIAEAYYGIPDDLIQECRKRLPLEMRMVVDEFNISIVNDYKGRDDLC